MIPHKFGVTFKVSIFRTTGRKRFHHIINEVQQKKNNKFGDISSTKNSIDNLMNHV
jgi:hypothetical protein